MATTREIRGNTLRVYLYVLKHGPCELRDIQHGLDLSTASLASYHLDRLVEAGYAQKNEQGRYFVTSESPGQILAGYSKLGMVVVPRLFFFSLLFTILTSFFSYESVYNAGFTGYLVVTSIAMVVVLWFETVRLWRRLAS